MPPDLLEQVYALVREKKERTAMDVIFRNFDDALREGRHEACEAVLNAVDLDLLTPLLVISFLTITKAAAWCLPARSAFVRRARPWLLEKIGEERTTELLKARD
jgi:hypothetical protein